MAGMVTRERKNASLLNDQGRYNFKGLKHRDSPDPFILTSAAASISDAVATGAHRGELTERRWSEKRAGKKGGGVGVLPCELHLSTLSSQVETGRSYGDVAVTTHPTPLSSSPLL